MYKFPVRLPSNLNLHITQPYHVRGPVDASRALSIQTTDHIGIDIDCGTPEQTWGQECVWPFPWPGIVWDSQVDSPFNAPLHAHAQIDTVDPDTGIAYSVVYIHLSAVTNTKEATENKVITYQQGETIGKIGNNGFVTPAPTAAQPYLGSHLHLGLGVKKPGDTNYLMVDPATMFDVNSWYVRDIPSVTVLPFNRNLSMGMRGDDVTRLQARIGVNPQTNFFGTLTFAKVIAYQKANGITPTGFVGPLTRARLNSL